MESIKLKSHVGDDGVLQIELPINLKNEDLEVLIVYQPLKASASDRSETPESRGWHPDFFEKVLGSWKGEPLERPEQLPYDVREALSLDEDVS